MNIDRDLIIWKLNEEVSRARLALGRIYNIAMKVYCPETKHASSFLGCDEVEEIVETLQEFFGEDKAIEALKRYAEGKGYIGVSPDGEAFEFEESEYGLDEMKIGWLARQTLKEIEQ